MFLAFGFTILRVELTILRYVRAALMLNNHVLPYAKQKIYSARLTKKVNLTMLIERTHLN